MAGPSRSKLQREGDRRRAAELSLRGLSAYLFVATIVLTQGSFEELLRDRARITYGVAGNLPSGTLVDAASFAELLAQGVAQGWITRGEHQQLSGLRIELRNPYVHTKDIQQSGRVQRGDFAVQAAKFDMVGAAVELEARDAASMLVRLVPTISRRAWAR
jgi:hypothetical protein